MFHSFNDDRRSNLRNADPFASIQRVSREYCAACPESRVDVGDRPTVLLAAWRVP
ncbi:hypothetical protein D3C84_1285440 [compost metagenome]